MATKEELEIYKQRYETFRFFYRLEWQLLQVGVVIGLGLLALGVERDSGNLNNWQFLAGGGVFLGFSYAMHRMAIGTRKNHPSWMHYARRVGDANVREMGSPWKSAAVQARMLLFSAGGILIIVGVVGVCSANRIHGWLKYATAILMVLEIALWIAWQTWKPSAQPRWIPVALFAILILIAILMGTGLVLYRISD